MKKFLQVVIAITLVFLSSSLYLPAKAGAGTSVSGNVTVTTCSADGSLATVWDISGTFYNVSAGDYLIMTLYTPGKSYQYTFLGGQPASSNLASVSFKVRQNSPTSVYTGGSFTTGAAAGNQVSNTNRTLEFYDSLSGTHKVGSYKIQFQCDVPVVTATPTPTKAPVVTKTPTPIPTRVPVTTSAPKPTISTTVTATPTVSSSPTITEEPTATDTPLSTQTTVTVVETSGSTSFSTPSWLGYVCCFFFLVLVVAVGLLAFYLNRRKKDKPVTEKPSEESGKKEDSVEK